MPREINKFIQNGEIKLAINSLIKNSLNTNNNGNYHNALIISSSFYTYEKDVIRGLLKKEERNIQLAKISQAILLANARLDNFSELEIPNKSRISFQLFSYDTMWVGRANLVNKLVELYTKGNKRMFFIFGLSGIGKTALAEKLILSLNDWNKNQWNVNVLRVNLEAPQKDVSFLAIAQNWANKWNFPSNFTSNNIELLYQKVSNFLIENELLILFDSFEKLLEEDENNKIVFKDTWWEKLFKKLLSVESCRSRFIITSQELPDILEYTRYQNLVHKEILQGLSNEEIFELFKKTELYNFKPKEVDIILRIANVYKGHPLVIRVIIGEITEDFCGNIMAYWNNISEKIIEIEKTVKEAKADASKNQGKYDKWNLHKLTRNIDIQLNQDRLNTVFERLEKQNLDAFLLICTSSAYRISTLEVGWFIQLEGLIQFLEGDICTNERKINALQALKKRFLVEISYDKQNRRLLGQHTLIRSISLERMEAFLKKYNNG